MRVIQKSIETQLGVTASLWFTKDVIFNSDRDEAMLTFKGYEKAEHIMANKNPLEIKMIVVRNIMNMPKTVEAGSVNVYELVFEQLLIKVLQDDFFKGGILADI